MLIRAYGLFWRRDEIEWSPGQGRPFRLLGRRGKNLPGLSVTDIRRQRGIYILYNHYGAYYVGLTIKRDLGLRLHDHNFDEHAREWDRFSWFGFCPILKSTDESGIRLIKELAKIGLSAPADLIGDTEALLIYSLGTINKKKMRFKKAHYWEQIPLDAADQYLRKVG